MRPAHHAAVRQLQRAIREGEQAMQVIVGAGLHKQIPAVERQRAAFWELRREARKFLPGNSPRLKAEFAKLGVDTSLRPVSRVGAQILTLCGESTLKVRNGGRVNRKARES